MNETPGAAPPYPSPAASEHPFDSLLQGYTVPRGHFDELQTADGVLRAPWQRFFAHAGDVSREALDRVQARIARQIHENGITYNVYAAGDGAGRPWTLDVLPLIMSPEEWEPLAVGLRQRARLLNAVAADLYGPQHLLREGFVPPALVFRHPGFLRPCHGVQPPGEVFLHLVAFDLGRGPDGKWRIVGTRTQAPSGAGYALENRATLSRLFPEAFRAMRVQGLAVFFETLRATLLSSVRAESEAPHVVLLTPGPYNETYFEHAYLAKQLGFPLVEGGDLTVRHDRVFLKTVSGLQRVHGVLRRLDDDYCDPLELRPDSTLGVAGLLQAWRSGNVVVANAFGTGLLESPALLGFLPSICERLLREPMLLPALATWWCGEAAAFADARERLGDGVVKPAFDESAMEPVFLSAVDATSHDEWVQRLSSNSDAYVVEEFLPLSHAPVWQDGSLQSRALMLRVFLCANGRGGYTLMPGGLLRIAGPDRAVVSGQRGGGSKDIWVAAPAHHADHSPAPDRHLRVEDVVRVEQITASRAAEHLFWLGRYAERSETCARLLRAVLSRLTDTTAFPDGWRAAFLRTCRRQGVLPPVDPTEDGPDDDEASTSAVERELIRGLFDRRSTHSLGFNIEQTVRVAGAVRDRLSSDNWRVLNRLLQTVMLADGQTVELDDALEVVDHAIISLVAAAGLEMAHMTRNDGWRFLSIGRHLERLAFMAATLEDVLQEGAPTDVAVLDWLLDLCDSQITYRARYMRQPEWSRVVDLLFFDALNPRAARFQIGKLDQHLRLLPEADLGDALEVLDRVRHLCEPPNTAQGDLFGNLDTLADVLAACERLATSVSDTLTRHYFSHVYEVPHPIL